MNEDVSKQETVDMEQGPDGVWRMQMKQESSKAEDLIEGIDGYEQMSPVEKINALKTLLSSLEDTNGEFTRELLVKKIKDLEASEEYINNMKNPGTSPGSIFDTKA